MSRQELSVKQLSELYNVIIGVALSLAILNTINLKAERVPLKLDTLLNFISFLFIVIPFYHGAVLHLYSMYVEKHRGEDRPKPGALLADYVLLFLGGCIFIAMGVLVGVTQLFTYSLIALLLLDVVWGFFAYLAFGSSPTKSPATTWAKINVGAVALLIVSAVFGPAMLQGWGIGMQLVVLVICAVRTVIDYFFCWDFYYPS